MKRVAKSSFDTYIKFWVSLVQFPTISFTVCPNIILLDVRDSVYVLARAKSMMSATMAKKLLC